MPGIVSARLVVMMSAICSATNNASMSQWARSGFIVLRGRASLIGASISNISSEPNALSGNKR